MPTQTLAKIMQKENKDVFAKLENARSTLRYIEGKHGRAKRAHKTIEERFVIDGERTKAPLPMPESWSAPRAVFKLPIACNRIAFMADFQVPFHDPKAIKAFVDWVKEKDVNTVFINGDFCDFYGVSSFERDPKQRNFKEELDSCRAMLAWLRDQFPTQTIYYNMESNHEIRWEKWLYRRPEVLDLPEFQMDIILRLNDFGIIPLKKHKYILIGNLPVLHGHTIFGKWGSGVSKGRSVFNKAYTSSIVSHVHITDEWTTRTLTGKVHTCWTTGCFMNIDAVEYNEHNNYNNGGAFIRTDNDGNYWVENKRIIDYKVY